MSAGAGRRRPAIPALDGVRAIAVALVLADHGGIPGVSGGFIGVDVFFVLSGFLITSLLFDERRRSGRIALTDFWVRRARRLLPALLVMTLTVVFARDVFPPDAVAGLRDDALAALLWVANWSQIARHTDYFSQGGTPSPLQHTWSLGVEEQFYLIWPIVFVGLAALFAILARPARVVRSGAEAQLRTLRIAIGVLAGAGAVASAVAAVLLASDTSRDRIYFGTDTRAQALLLGAAASALLVADWPALIRGRSPGGSLTRSRSVTWFVRALPLAGLAALAAVAHYATGDTAEFGRGLLTVVALAAVIVIVPVALDQRGLVARILAWRPLASLGVISYGIYLWHWPVFLVVDGQRTGWSGTALFVVRCLVTVAVATASWWLVEQPIRRWRPSRVPWLRLAAATIATAAVVTVQIVPVGLKPTVLHGVSPAVAQLPVDPAETARPAAVPSRNTGTRTVSVFGDSIGWTLMRYLPATPGLSFVDRTTIGCGIVKGGPYRYFGQTLDQKPECDTWPSRWAQRIRHDRPDVVLLIIGRWETMDRLLKGRWTHIGEPGFDDYLAEELRRALDILGSTGARVVVTTEPYNRRGEQPDGSLYPEDQPVRVDRWNALMRRVVAQRPGVTVLDLNKKLNPDGYYARKVNGIQVRSDGVHLTQEAVKWLTPWLEDALQWPTSVPESAATQSQ